MVDLRVPAPIFVLCPQNLTNILTAIFLQYA